MSLELQVSESIGAIGGICGMLGIGGIEGIAGIGGIEGIGLSGPPRALPVKYTAPPVLSLIQPFLNRPKWWPE